MRHRIIACWLIFSLLAISGLSLKVLGLEFVHSVDFEQEHFAKIEPVIYANGFYLSAIQKPTTDKNFIVHTYIKPECDGVLALLALSRNSEGAEIIKSQFSHKLMTTYFIFSGEQYKKFPELLFWWRKFYKNLTNLGQNLKQRKEHLVVWAVVETSSCASASQIRSYL